MDVFSPERKPQVPPLRFAPVGMTILLRSAELQREKSDPQLNCHPDRSEAQWRDLRFLFRILTSSLDPNETKDANYSHALRNRPALPRMASWSVRPAK